MRCRPRYGFYLDHLTDMFSAAAICIGLGLSPYLLLFDFEASRSA